MGDYRRQVAAAIQATAFHSPTSYSWFGRLSRKLSPLDKRALTPQSARYFLLFDLESRLYADFYCPGRATPSPRSFASCSTAHSIAFGAALAAANAGGGCREEGWQVFAVDGECVIVRRRGLQVWVNRRDCLVREGECLEIGTTVAVGVEKDLPNASPGFYVALGDKGLGYKDPAGLVRVYWNLTADGAVHFMRIVTERLNRANLAFRLKALQDPASYRRCDAAVLYIQKGDYPAARDALEESYPRIASHLKPAVPAFTKRLADGIGIAENVGDGDSFGLHRCRLLADGLIRAYERNITSTDERLRVVKERFSEDGISLDAPYLSAGSNDDYEFSRRCMRPSKIANVATGPVGTAESANAFLRTADELGGRLCQQAVWHNGRCNWLGAGDRRTEHGSQGQTRMALKALGAELYGGTSGIALFLAELHKATGNAQARETALGAVRHALSRADALRQSGRFGLYTGGFGIAYAAARVGTVLGEEELRLCAVKLLQHHMYSGGDDREFDIISGRAGAIATLLALRDVSGDPWLLDFARQLGDELLHAATVSRNGYSWASPDIPSRHNLTGFAHGAAGIGYALLELYSATDDARYRAAAEGAFSYESHWFDAEAGNWPDFRDEAGYEQRGRKRPLSFATVWCHGAPGIALSRLRAYEILGDELYKREAVAALRATRRVIETWLWSGHENYSLCHGLAGNADVLLSGYRMLGEEAAADAMLARQTGCAGVESYAVRGQPWYCGTDASETPGLMLGLAGIGYFYLRLHNPNLPSVLILA